MSTQPLQVLLAGTPHTTVMVGEALLAAGHIVATVLCPFPKPVGRKKVITPSDVEQWATSKHIPVVHVNKEIFQDAGLLSSLPPADLLVVADFGYLVPAWLLSYPKHGALNIHPSLLPRWRGATPVPFTLLFGDTETGVTIIKMNEHFDKGSIVTQRKVELSPTDTTPTLLAKGFKTGAELLVEALPDYIDGKIAPKPQDSASPTPLTQKFTKDDGFVPFETLKACIAGQKTVEPAPLLAKYGLETSSSGIDNMVRALTPWPGVWTLRPDGKRVKILETKLENDLLKPLAIQVEGQKAEIFTTIF